MFLSDGGYWPRITTYDGRAIEQALAGSSLFDHVPRLRGAVVEASYALTDPPILKALQERGVPYLVDPQSLRFHTPTYLEIPKVASLPYAPAAPLTPHTAGNREFVEKALAFQAHVGASAYVVPALPTHDPGDNWHEANVQLHRTAADLNGTVVDRKSLVAFIAPSFRAMGSPDDVLKHLVDVPLDGVYIQPTKLSPHRDSVEKLVRYVRFGLTALHLDVPVFGGRVGSFGLALQAFGWHGFDSGLGEAESFDLAALNRARERKKPEAKKGGGRDRRVYLEPLKTTLAYKDVDAILSEPGLRARFVCSLPCCRFGGFEHLADQRREHYLRVRLDEVDRLQSLPPGPLRLDKIRNDFTGARDHARVVERTLRERGIAPPRFAHLETWMGVVARLEPSHDVAI